MNILRNIHWQNLDDDLIEQSPDEDLEEQLVKRSKRRPSEEPKLDDFDHDLLTQNEIGVDTEEVGITEEPASTYPVPKNKHEGVRTKKGTSPTETDQGDEQYDAKIYGTPDDSTKGYGNEGEDKYVDRPYIG